MQTGAECGLTEVGAIGIKETFAGYLISLPDQGSVGQRGCRPTLRFKGRQCFSGLGAPLFPKSLSDLQHHPSNGSC